MVVTVMGLATSGKPGLVPLAFGKLGLVPLASGDVPPLLPGSAPSLLMPPSVCARVTRPAGMAPERAQRGHEGGGATGTVDLAGDGDRDRDTDRCWAWSQSVRPPGGEFRGCLWRGSN